MEENIEFFELNTGAKIPSVGLGTWQASPRLVGEALTAVIKVFNYSSFVYIYILCLDFYFLFGSLWEYFKKINK